MQVSYLIDVAGAQWPILLAIQCMFPLILACGVMFLPESPRWVSESIFLVSTELRLSVVFCEIRR